MRRKPHRKSTREYASGRILNVMLTRRACAIAIGNAVLLPPALAAPPRRIALLFAVPWEKESWLGNDLSKVRDGLRTRGLDAAEMISVSEQLDRDAFSNYLAQGRRRIAQWRDGEVFLYYSGHGMYRASAGGLPEPGLQLNRDRDVPSSALLWREVFALLGAPPGVRVLVLPDCCHTNLLAGRMPSNVTALIGKSEPQTALTCRTGSALFGESPARQRYGVISYYAGETIAGASTAQGWLDAIHTAAEKDISQSKLRPGQRLTLMLEGNPAVPLPGRSALAQGHRMYR